jgi:acetyl-CoA synthetase
MHDNIESHLVEKRVFKPPRNFSRRARIKSLGQYRRMYRIDAAAGKFWAREASELVWRARWKKVLEMEGAVREVVRRGKTQHLEIVSIDI